MIVLIERKHADTIVIRLYTHHTTGKAYPDMTVLGREDEVGGSFACQLVRGDMGYLACAGIYLLDAVGAVVQQCPYIPFTVGD